ncbi:hypothetical protein [Actinomycetospora corticicola]|uniref:hypothetical protein n=1 Tax=Actinomycetospora corticicola TaxID=663602 RepID=UPI001C541536|nr:hypothetical protein [Actinomycetospora corticicola]
MTGEDGQRWPTADGGGQPCATADTGAGGMPGLVVEPETLPDGRSITYFSTGDGAQRSSTRSAGDGAQRSSTRSAAEVRP